MQTTAYDVFISYSRLDRSEAVQLEQALAAARLANGQPVKVFRDETRLEVGDHVDVVIPAEHNASAIVIVLWSANAAQSKWVQNEAIGAIFGLKYYPLMLDGFDPKGLPADVRPLNAGRLSLALADVPALVAEIERRKKLRLPANLQVEIHNSMPTSGQGDVLIGRDAELAMLHQAWGGSTTNMVVLDAMGGTGKTALLNRFLDDLANNIEAPWGGAERVYAWSFYSQGTDEKRQGDADGFFATALDWFGYRGEPVHGAERGRKLAALVREKRTLMVLDGLEPLQYPAHLPGLEGKLKDDGLATLLKALADQMHGLAVVNTRISVPELRARTEPTVVRRELNQLTVEAGVKLLTALGVKADQEHFRDVVGLLNGHALSLNLLATYSKKRLRGMLPVRREIEELLFDKNLGGAAFAMMRRYEILMDELVRKNSGSPEAAVAARELAILYLIGLFDRPAEPAALAALKREPITGLTDQFGTWDAGAWDFAVAALRDVKLLLPEGAPGELDAHPLVREYFGRRLRETRPEPFREANFRLYEFYKLKDVPPAFRDPVRYGLVAVAAERGAEEFQQWLKAKMNGQPSADNQSKLPPTLRGIPPTLIASYGSDDATLAAAVRAAQPESVRAMEPLFTAIAHGCAAGHHDAAFHEVYLPRITRGNKYFATARLGAFSADLSALAHFFEHPFSVPSNKLAAADQSRVLSIAAFGLRALGRLTEAIAPLELGLAQEVTACDWHFAAISASNLSQVRLAIGDTGGSIAAGADAVRYADAIANSDPGAGYQRAIKRTTHGDALFRAGDLAGAAKLFVDAEMQGKKAMPDFRTLTLFPGYLYCDLLLANGQAVEVRQRATTAMDVARRNDRLLAIALDTLSLGRAALALGDKAKAAESLDAAVTALEDAGISDHIPRGLLARAALHRVTGAFQRAVADLDATVEIADRSGLVLFQIDAAIERARLTLACDGSGGCQFAINHLVRAKDLIEKTRSRDHGGVERHYAKPAPDLALVEARKALLSGDTAAAKTHLAEAQLWIDQGWGCHKAEHAELAKLLAAAKPRKRWWHR